MKVRRQWRPVNTLISLVFISLIVINVGAIKTAEAKVEPLNVQSPDFTSGALIPTKFSADGKDVSPNLYWSKAPAGSKSIAITCTDPDAPRGVWWHWILFNLAPETTFISTTLTAN